MVGHHALTICGCGARRGSFQGFGRHLWPFLYVGGRGSNAVPRGATDGSDSPHHRRQRLRAVAIIFHDGDCPPAEQRLRPGSRTCIHILPRLAREVMLETKSDKSKAHMTALGIHPLLYTMVAPWMFAGALLAFSLYGAPSRFGEMLSDLYTFQLSLDKLPALVDVQSFLDEPWLAITTLED
eukprot:6345186-Amphidinium_carterae.1